MAAGLTPAPAAEWRVGSWTLVPDGLSACGNELQAPDGQPSDALERLRAAPAQQRGAAPESLAERLNACRDSMQVIAADEVEQLLDLLGQGEDTWETVQLSAQTQVKRHRDRSLFGGTVFVRLSCAPIPHATLPVIAHCFCNYPYRSGWDSQIFDFRLLHNMAGNDVFYYKLKAPPLYDRDFLCLQTIFRHDDGKKLMIYTRSVDASLGPSCNDAVRAWQYMLAVEIEEHEGGGASFTCTTAVDPKIPFMPKWVINMMVPMEFRKWVSAVDARCAELAAADFEPPCSHVCAPRFEPLAVDGSVPAAPAAEPEAAVEPWEEEAKPGAFEQAEPPAGEQTVWSMVDAACSTPTDGSVASPKAAARAPTDGDASPKASGKGCSGCLMPWSRDGRGRKS